MNNLTLDTGATFVKVPSDTDPGKTYAVEIQNGKAWWCQCKSWQYSRPEGGCKHMVSAQKDLDQLVMMLDVVSDLAAE